jgi:hypothetical protein
MLSFAVTPEQSSSFAAVLGLSADGQCPAKQNNEQKYQEKAGTHFENNLDQTTQVLVALSLLNRQATNYHKHSQIYGPDPMLLNPKCQID